MSTIRIQRRPRLTAPAIPTAPVSLQPPPLVPRKDRKRRNTNWTMHLLLVLTGLASVALFFLPVIEHAGQALYDSVNAKLPHGGTGANALVLHFG